MPLIPENSTTPSSYRLYVALGCWFLLCVAGLGVMTVYSNTPSEAGAASPQLLDAEAINLDPELPTLVMYIHPKCPCTKASAEQLARLQAQQTDRLAIRVVAFSPDDTAGDWHETNLWDRLHRMPGVIGIVDRDGEITRRAGAVTSGTIGLYEPDGRLVFWGGITPARGHAGDSIGFDSIVNYLEGRPFNDRGEVYGCQILSDRILSDTTETQERCPDCHE